MNLALGIAMKVIIDHASKYIAADIEFDWKKMRENPKETIQWAKECLKLEEKIALKKKGEQEKNEQ